jgi:hypothetical protein
MVNLDPFSSQRESGSKEKGGWVNLLPLQKRDAFCRSLFSNVAVFGDIPITLSMNDIERQIQLEAAATQDGVRRYAESFKYHLATDTKPVGSFLRRRAHDADGESSLRPGLAPFHDGPR